MHVYSAHPYYQRAPRHATLILGYTTVAVEEIGAGVERLALAIAKMGNVGRLAIVGSKEKE